MNKKKGRFLPTPRPRRVVKTPKKEADGDDQSAGLEILQRFQEIGKKGKPEFSKDSSAKPNGTGSITGYSGIINGDASKSRDGKQKALRIPSTDISNDAAVCSNSDAAVTWKIKKDYVEPWDYCGHYPTSLPLRRPFSGDPGVLNKLEFGENQSSKLDESSKHHATELGLHKESGDAKLFFVQLPDNVLTPKQLGARRPDTNQSSVPMDKAGPSTIGREIVLSPPTSQCGSSASKERAVRPIRAPTETNRFEGFPKGHIGKMQVYKSGKVKWKIGDCLFDVAPGIHSEYMAQDLVAINRKEKTYCEIGQLVKTMIVSPDVDCLLNSIRDLM